MVLWFYFKAKHPAWHRLYDSPPGDQHLPLPPEAYYSHFPWERAAVRVYLSDPRLPDSSVRAPFKGPPYNSPGFQPWAQLHPWASLGTILPLGRIRSKLDIP